MHRPRPQPCSEGTAHVPGTPAPSLEAAQLPSSLSEMFLENTLQKERAGLYAMLPEKQHLLIGGWIRIETFLTA